MKKRILVLERSRTIQILLRTYFNNDGHQVITCSTPQEALQILASLHDVPDMIFLAIDHEKEAYKVVRYVKEHRAYTNIHLVALVLEEERAAIQRTLGESNMHYLVKPFHIQEALALVSAPGTAYTGARTIGREENP